MNEQQGLKRKNYFRVSLWRLIITCSLWIEAQGLGATGWAAANGGRHISSIDETYVSMNFPEIKFIKQYMVEIYADRSLNDSVLKTRLNSRKFTWDEPDPGTYYLRYAVVDEWGQVSEWSDVSRLYLSYDPALLERPELSSPDANEKMTFEDDEEINFEWETVDWAKSYELVISQDPSLGSGSFQKTTKENELEIEMKKLGGPGHFYWKISARSGRMLKQSKLRSFYLIKEEPPPPDPSEKLEAKQEELFVKQYQRLRHSQIIFLPSVTKMYYETQLSTGETGYSGSVTAGGMQGEIRYQTPTLHIYQFEMSRYSGTIFSNLLEINYTDYGLYYGDGFPLSDWVKLELLVGVGQTTLTSVSKKTLEEANNSGTGQDILVSNDSYRMGLGKLSLWFFTGESRYHEFKLFGAYGGLSRYGGSYIYSNTFWSGPLIYQLALSQVIVTATSPRETEIAMEVSSVGLSLGTTF